MKQYDAYLFDLYGTLVDIHTDERKPGFWKKITAYYQQNGAVYEPREFRSVYQRLCAEAVERLCEKQHCSALEGEIDLGPVFAELYRIKGVSASAELTAETAWYFRKTSTMHLRAYAGAIELLQTLRKKGKKVFLLSNAQALFTRPELDLLGLTEQFDEIYISSDCAFRKPASQFIQWLLTEQDLKPDQCLMIGNDPAADVGVAKSVGMDCLYIRSGQSPKIDLDAIPADYVQPAMDLRRLKRRLLPGLC